MDTEPSRDHTDPTRTVLPHEPGADGESLLVDCDRCSGRGIECGDCVVTVLLGGPPEGVALDEDEQRALDVLAAAGLVPPLRMVEAVDGREV